VRSPARSEVLLRATAEAARKVLGGESKDIVTGVLHRLFPEAPEASIADLVHAVEAFLGGNYAQALDRASAIVDVRGIGSFLSFLKGASHAGLAGYLRRDLLLATSYSQVSRQALEARRLDHAREAMAEFRSEPGLVASRLELLLLEFEELPSQGDVPDELLQRIREISDSEEAGHRGYYLLAQTLRRRFVHRHADDRIRNSDLLRILGGEQKALRNCIRRYPYFNRAYIALAELFLTPEAGSSAPAGKGPRRSLFRPDSERAINVLKAAPEPDADVLSALAAQLDAGDRTAAAEATPYLERLCRSRPEARAFERLIENYVRIGDPAAHVLLEEGLFPLERPPAGLTRERWKALLQLRTGFESLPEYQGVRLACLGNMTAAEESRTQSAPEKLQLRRRAIDYYTRSLAAYDVKKLPPPVLVLNNLAWYLTQEDDAASRARAVEVATRGVALVPEIERMPNMYDTLAWALFRNEQPIEAESVLRKLITVADQPTFRYHLACILFKVKRYDEALREVDKARKSVEDFPESEAAMQLERDIREARGK
jgi:tetratricopeptide (TPR) repeat protein